MQIPEAQVLQEQANRLSQILEGNSIPTFVIDHNHLVTHWNKACEKLTSVDARDIIGTDRQWVPFYGRKRPVLADLIVDNAPEDEYITRYGEKYRKSDLIAGACEAEDFFAHLGAEGKWLFFTAAPLYDTQGAIVGSIETFQDMTQNRRALDLLTRREKELDEKTRYLEKVNQALKATLDHREIEKRAVEQNLLVNLKKRILPYIEALQKCKLSSDARAYTNILATNLADFIAPFSTRLFSRYMDLTPTEIQVADLIREGKNTKAIAAMLCISPSSVQWHRKNIRAKLGLTNRKVNLRTYLGSLDNR